MAAMAGDVMSLNQRSDPDHRRERRTESSPSRSAAAAAIPSMGFGLTGEPGSLIIGNALVRDRSARPAAAAAERAATVTVNHTGDITVLGEGSQAIVAESINGGGGTINLRSTGRGDLRRRRVGFGGTARPAGRRSFGVHQQQRHERRQGHREFERYHRGRRGRRSGINLQAIGGGGGTIMLHGRSSRRSSRLRRSQSVSLPRHLPVRRRPDHIALGSVDGTDNDGGDLEGAQEGQVLTEGDTT